MTQMNTNIESVSSYFKTVPKEALPHLRELWGELTSRIPQGKKVVRYGIPTIQLDGKNIVHCAGYTTHVGFYPGSKAIVHFKKELTNYKTSKGTVQFSLDKKLPLTLIRTMTTYCVSEHTHHAKTR